MTEQEEKKEITSEKRSLVQEETSTETAVENDTKKRKTEESKPESTVSTGSGSPEELLKQVEFYFSDANLPNDRFLWKTTQENDGWVPLKTIRSFKRMARYSSMSNEDVAEALKKSKDLLEVSENDEKVRRKKPLVEPKQEEKQEQFARTVYVKGFGEEHDSLQVEIEKFFEQFGPIEQVRLRRNDEKQFKGSVFAEFKSLKDAEKFVGTEPKPKFQEQDLVTMSKLAYVQMKQAEHGFTAGANGKRPRKFNAFRENAKKK